MIKKNIFKRHLHDLSHYVIGDTLAGTLKCVGITENLPNDTFVGKTEAIIRTDPMKHPTMHPLKTKLYHVWCPTRLVWPDFHKFITQGKYGSTPPVLPFIEVEAADALPGSLLDTLGVKAPAGADKFRINAIPISMFNLICNTLFMDQDLGTERIRSDASGDRTGLEDITNFQCNWPNDYFNTARPWAQKSPSIPIPQSNIVSNDETITVRTQTTIPTTDRDLYMNNTGDVLATAASPAGNENLRFGSETGLQMDDSAKMRDLSLAGALQIFFENRANDGSRFIEYLRSAFGSRIYDSQVQNPTVVGYNEKTIQFSEVIQTGVAEDSPLGKLAGHGVGGLGTNEYKYYMGEHGFFFTFQYVMPENAYLESMERFWLYQNFYDIYQREFEAIGQQPIYAGELMGKLAQANRYNTWGWQDRYSQYMRSLNRITGLFQTTNKDWTMAREFLTPPVLNEAFLTGAPTNRIFSDTDPSTPKYQVMAFNKIIARRNVKRSVRKRIL